MHIINFNDTNLSIGNTTSAFSIKQNQNALSVLKNGMVRPTDTVELSGLASAFVKAIEDLKAVAEDTKESLLSTESIATEQVQQVVDMYTEIGKKVEKPIDVNDFTWGLMVSIGDSMGIKGEDASARLSLLNFSDVVGYASEFMMKESESLKPYVESGELHKYSSPEAFWNAKFVTSEGAVVKNPNFKQDMPQTNFSTHVTAKGVVSGNREEILLSNAGESSLLLMAEGLAQGNFNKILYANASVGRPVNGEGSTWLSELTKQITSMKQMYNKSFQSTDPNGAHAFDTMNTLVTRFGLQDE